MTDIPLTKLAVKAILERASAHPWSLQGMGMFRLYLSREVRLHVWDMRFTVEKVSTVHTHPWDFTSHVLSGAITNRIFTKVEHGELQREPGFIAGFPGQFKEYREQQIVCGPGGGASSEPKRVYLYTPDDDGLLTHVTDSYYCQDASDIHESIPKSGTVTLLERTLKEDTEHAYVYFREGRSWVSAEPRDATEHEVLAMARMALDRWES